MMFCFRHWETGKINGSRDYPITDSCLLLYHHNGFQIAIHIVINRKSWVAENRIQWLQEHRQWSIVHCLMYDLYCYIKGWKRQQWVWCCHRNKGLLYCIFIALSSTMIVNCSYIYWLFYKVKFIECLIWNIYTCDVQG